METHTAHFRSVFHIFVGVSEHLDLRDRAKAKASGSFDQKKYNDNVLAFGSPLVRYISELMGL
jgi:hypothetical protein